MSPADWDHIQTLFHEASELAPHEREAYLNRQCGADAALRREVEMLLEESGAADRLFAGAIEEAAAGVLATQHGERIGPYAIDSRLGEGGMGVVYLAVRDDDQYRKQVAIKVVRSGLNSRESVARFRAERQILANLDHPGIARLLDGGATDSGAPYVVMEYVDGVPINDYCEKAGLSTRQRLALFLQVCEAVAYAHRNLVVHRDIKPANILVTHEGIPKLLDFGIAKLLTADPLVQTVRTMAMDRFLTPDYASPEQVRGSAISTATDVYSLGMLLYELLAGSRPFRMEGLTLTDCERLICEAEPAKPSTAGGRKELRGDLDSIILMALRKEPARRYGSVELLAQDIRRFLDGLPVNARPASWSYRAGKFSRRHRWGIGAGAAIVAILLVAVILTLSAERRAEAANAQSQQRFQDMLAMADSSLFEIHDAIVNLPGSTKARALVVRRALSYLDRLAKDHNQDPALRRELASAYERLSVIQYHDGAGYLGDSAGALASAEQALGIRRGLANEAPRDLAALHAVASDMTRIGEVQWLTRASGASEQSYAAALTILEGLQKSAPGDLQIEGDLADAHWKLGAVQRERGDLAGALPHLQQALRMREALMKRNPGDAPSRHSVEQICLTLSDFEREQRGDVTGALAYAQRALTIARGLSREFPEDRGYRTDVASALGDMGHAYAKSPEPRQALRPYEESLAIVESLSNSDPGDARMRRSVAIHNTNVALVLDHLHEDRAAEARYRRSLAIHLALYQSDPRNTQYMDDAAFVRSYLGTLLVRTGRNAEGAQQLQESIALRQALLRAAPDHIESSYRLGRTYEALGLARQKSGDSAAACRGFERAREILSLLKNKMSESADLTRLITRMADCGNTH